MVAKGPYPHCSTCRPGDYRDTVLCQRCRKVASHLIEAPGRAEPVRCGNRDGITAKPLGGFGQPLGLRCPGCNRPLDLLHADGGWLANLGLADAVCKELRITLSGALCPECQRKGNR